LAYAEDMNGEVKRRKMAKKMEWRMVLAGSMFGELFRVNMNGVS